MLRFIKPYWVQWTVMEMIIDWLIPLDGVFSYMVTLMQCLFLLKKRLVSTNDNISSEKTLPNGRALNYSLPCSHYKTKFHTKATSSKRDKTADSDCMLEGFCLVMLYATSSFASWIISYITVIYQYFSVCAHYAHFKNDILVNFTFFIHLGVH